MARNARPEWDARMMTLPLSFATRALLGSTCIWVASLWVVISARPQSVPGGLPSSVPPTIDYQRQVHTILAAKCLSCRSTERRWGLSLAAYTDALDGGRSGAAIRPGNSAGSLLMQRITGQMAPAMPLNTPALSAGEIATIRAWIDEGARDTLASAAAAPKWEAPLALARPRSSRRRLARLVDPRGSIRCGSIWPGKALCRQSSSSDATFARRAYLDIQGLLPPPEELRAFLADRNPNKRTALVAATAGRRATSTPQHWITFWNDLLRNEEGVNYKREQGRKSITSWLLRALAENRPYDQFVAQLLNPEFAKDDPDGFLIGVNWRGDINAGPTPMMQAAQNGAAGFLGVNLKCNSCHDSFISRWKLKDAYGLAGFFSEEKQAGAGALRCAGWAGSSSTPAFLFPELNRVPASDSLADRRRSGRGDLHRPAQRPDAAHAGESHLASPAGTRHRRKPRRNGWRAVESRNCSIGSRAISSISGYDLKRLLVDDRVVEGVSDARRSPRIGAASRAHTTCFADLKSGGSPPSSSPMPSASITGDWNVYQPPAPARGAATASGGTTCRALHA